MWRRLELTPTGRRNRTTRARFPKAQNPTGDVRPRFRRRRTARRGAVCAPPLVKAPYGVLVVVVGA